MVDPEKPGPKRLPRLGDWIKEKAAAAAGAPALAAIAAQAGPLAAQVLAGSLLDRLTLLVLDGQLDGIETLPIAEVETIGREARDSAHGLLRGISQADVEAAKATTASAPAAAPPLEAPEPEAD